MYQPSYHSVGCSVLYTNYQMDHCYQVMQYYKVILTVMQTAGSGVQYLILIMARAAGNILSLAAAK